MYTVRIENEGSCFKKREYDKNLEYEYEETEKIKEGEQDVRLGIQNG